MDGADGIDDIEQADNPREIPMGGMVCLFVGAVHKS
jgi:hypothetical protein